LFVLHPRYHVLSKHPSMGIFSYLTSF
jgi:hypothetical protein